MPITYNFAQSNPFRSLQWHLDGTLTSGGNQYGANVDSVQTEFSGAGIRIGFLDEGWDLTTADLNGRFDLGASTDYADGGTVSIQADVGDVHGTWVAGVAGAKNDSTGVLGVAYGAELVGFYTRFGLSTRTEVGQNLDDAGATSDVVNNSWGFDFPFADNTTDSAWDMIFDPIRYWAENGRGGLGTSYVFSAGNDRQYVGYVNPLDGDNTNNHGLFNSRQIITVGATDNTGVYASFSAPGASILVVAPGVSIATSEVNDHIPNNDWVGVSGTSFSAPIVSGIVALMLEANPNLGYRDVQEILAVSAHKTDPTDAGWVENGADNWNGGGHFVSHDYGFGLVDAHAAVRIAETYLGTPQTAANEVTLAWGATNGGGTTVLTDNVPMTFYASPSGTDSDMDIQWTEVAIQFTHTHIGDLKVNLISPDGTDSVLMDMPNNGTNTRDNLNWVFTTNHNWGEHPNDGSWSVVIEDAGANGSGQVDSVAINFYGSAGSDDDTYVYTPDYGAHATLTDTTGTDTINAAAVTGNTTLYLWSGPTSTLQGQNFNLGTGTSIERAFTGDGNDTIYGDNGFSDLHGGRGNDVIYGNGGDDLLWGNAGDDVLDGGTDSAGDTMYGGTGDDIYYVDSAADDVLDFSSEGTDTVYSSVNYTLGSTGTEILRAAVSTNSLTLHGSDGNNVIVGASLWNTSQVLYGEDGSDVIYGNAGPDQLFGGNGGDYLDGKGGADLYTGGSGNDLMFFAAGEAVGDVIADFTSGNDVIWLSGYGVGATLTQLNATDYEIGYGASLTNHFQFAGALTLTGSDYAFI